MTKHKDSEAYPAGRCPECGQPDPPESLEPTDELVQQACLAYGGSAFPKRMRRALEVVFDNAGQPILRRPYD